MCVVTMAHTLKGQSDYDLENENRRLRLRVQELERLRDEMYAQLGGLDDPRTNPGHPGHILTRLGWVYSPDDEGEPDYYGCFWVDPDAPRGKMEVVSLCEALGRALKRLFPSRWSRISEV